MGGKVIETLCSSPVLTATLTADDFKVLANCGRLCSYRPGEIIAEPENEQVYVLRTGRVLLHVTVFARGGRCGGETDVELDKPGKVFGWGAWVRPDRIAVSALAAENVTVAVLSLKRLQSPESIWRLRSRMLQILYGLLQEHGLCPPNIPALLELGHVPT